MTTEKILDIIMWMVGGFCVLLGVCISFAINALIRLTTMEQRVTKTEKELENLQHTTDAIKEQVNESAITMAGISQSLSTLVESNKIILHKLDRYDERIIEYFKDLENRK